MANSKSSNNTVWQAWLVCHAAAGSSLVSVEFFSSKNSAAEEPETSARGEAAPAAEPPDSGNTGRDFL